jgi:uncharacterized protein (TIGR03083 family)
VAVVIDETATATALRAAGARLSRLLTGVSDPSRRAGGLEWTVAETAAHVVGSLELYAAFMTGERDANTYLRAAHDATTPGERNAVGNRLWLQEFAERDLSRLAPMVLDRVEKVIAAVAGADPEMRFLTEAGVRMSASVMSAACLGELLVHGHDIARGAGLQWSIPRAEAQLVIAGVVALVPEYVDTRATAGKHLTYELRFRGGPRYRVTIDDGTAQVGEPGRRPDCWISADPTAFLLVGYGRVSQWGQALRGRLLAGGPKPWLGLQFAGMLQSI